MKLLHTSDWHLGRALHGRKRYEEFEAFLAFSHSAGRLSDFDAAKIVERGGAAINKTLTLRLTEMAETDLAEIWAYIATETDEAMAPRFLEAMERTMTVLRHSPLIGAKREQPGAGLHVAFHAPYANYYLASEQEVIIIHRNAFTHNGQGCAATAGR